METGRTTSPSTRCRRRDPECRRNARWRAATGPACRPEYAASCPCSICPHQTRADRSAPPFFGALDALTIDNAGGGACFSFRLFAAFDVERVMNAIQHAIALPPNEVVMDRAARRKILRQVAPLTAGAQDVHDAVHHRAHVLLALAAARLRRRHERLDQRPLVIRQVARIAQMITIVSRTVLVRPHRRPPPRIRTASLESQPIPQIQQVLGRTLSGPRAVTGKRPQDEVFRSVPRVAAPPLSV